MTICSPPLHRFAKDSKICFCGKMRKKLLKALALYLVVAVISILVNMEPNDTSGDGDLNTKRLSIREACQKALNDLAQAEEERKACAIAEVEKWYGYTDVR